jgi:hypothetical protein
MVPKGHVMAENDSLWEVVIFYDITGFQGRGFLQLISINRRLMPNMEQLQGITK